jgi:hypothetical protein
MDDHHFSYITKLKKKKILPEFGVLSQGWRRRQSGR